MPYYRGITNLFVVKLVVELCKQGSKSKRYMALIFMEANMEARNIGRAILGFLISFFVVCLLIGNGILIGLKTTVLRGSDVMDLLENTNAFDVVSQLMMTELDSEMEDEPVLKSVMETVFSEELIREVASDVVCALATGEDVDLTGVAKKCLITVKATYEDMIDTVFDEVGAKGEISLDELMQNELLQVYEREFGREFTPILRKYIRSTYGDSVIRIDEDELENLKSKTKTALREELFPEIENVVDAYMVYINKTVNQELQVINDECDANHYCYFYIDFSSFSCGGTVAGIS